VKNRDTIEPFGCLFRVQFSPHYVINHNLTGQSADELVPRRWGAAAQIGEIFRCLFGCQLPVGVIPRIFIRDCSIRTAAVGCCFTFN
jgi:hypothetical protein